MTDAPKAFTQLVADLAEDAMELACSTASELDTRNAGRRRRRIAGRIIDAHAAVCAERDALVAAIDHEMVNCLMSTFTLGDDPKKALNTLLDWAQGLGAYFAQQRHEEAPHE